MSHTSGKPGQALHPRTVIELLNELVRADALIYCDIGNVTAWAIRYLRRELPGTFFTDTVSGSMDYAIPAALGGKLAQPNVPVFALVGDGGALMGSILDVFTAVELGVSICVVVFNDGGWGMLEHGVQQSPFRRSPRPAFRFQHRVDFAQLALALKADGIAVRSAEEMRAALAQCAATARVTVLDVAIDPSAEPPIGGRTAHVNRHISGGS